MFETPVTERPTCPHGKPTMAECDDCWKDRRDSIRAQEHAILRRRAMAIGQMLRRTYDVQRNNASFPGYRLVRLDGRATPQPVSTWVTYGSLAKSLAFTLSVLDPH